MTRRLGQRSNAAWFAEQFVSAAWPDPQDRPPLAAAVLTVVEEAGEFAGAYRRANGWARRRGTWLDVEMELADVVIAAYTAATRLGIALDSAIAAKAEIIMSRGFKE